MRWIVIGMLLAGVAGAEAEWVERPLKEAEELAHAEKFVEAARVYGKAFARAQKNRDPLASQRLLRSLEKSTRRLWKWKSGPDGAGPGGLRATLHALMRELDPERGDVFCSAHLLAQQLLLRATWAGDTRFVKDAAKVLRDYADEDETGKCAQVMAMYAAGMVAKVDGDANQAGMRCAGAFEQCLAEGWLDLALFLAVETAASGGAPARAQKTMERFAAAYPEDGDPALMVMWTRLHKARLKDAPAAVRAPYEQARDVEREESDDEDLDREGAHGGRSATSVIGRRWDGFSKRKPVATATRTDRGIALATRLDKRLKHVQYPLHGVRYHHYEGLHFGFFGHAVMLAKIDFTGKEDEPPPARWRSPFMPFYHLAKGEQWRFNKRGQVEVERE